MSIRKRLTTARWLLPVYLLTVTVSGWFHNHPAHDCAEQVECHASGGFCPASCGVERTEARLPHGDAPSDSSPSETCPVCHFLAQKPVPAETVEEVTSSALPEEVAQVLPAPVWVDVPTVHHSRAPPSVA